MKKEETSTELEVKVSEEAKTDIQAVKKANGVSERQTQAKEAVDEMMEDSEYLERQRKKEKRRKNLYRFGFIVAIIIIIILLLKGCSTDKNLTNNTRLPELETADLVKQEIDTEGYEVPRIYLPSITCFSVSSDRPFQNLGNPEENKDRYYFSFEFYVDGEEEPFYESKMVEGGKYFSVNFKELLPVGEYQATAIIHTYEYSSLEEKSGGTYPITITVLE